MLWRGPTVAGSVYCANPSSRWNWFIDYVYGA
jgi:hypothetical protein